MGNFIFNNIFQKVPIKVPNSSNKANTNCQALTRQAQYPLTSHKKPHLLPRQIWGAQVAPHGLLLSWCSPEPGSHPHGGCRHMALCVSDVVAAPPWTRWKFHQALKTKKGNKSPQVIVGLEVEMMSLSSA